METNNTNNTHKTPTTMIIIYTTRRALLDSIDGNANIFKPVISGLKEYIGQIEYFTHDENGNALGHEYQSFAIEENVFIDFCSLMGYNYHDLIFSISQACVDNVGSKSQLRGAKVYLKANASILTANVPTALPGATTTDYTDVENPLTTNHTFATWYANPVGEGNKDAADGKKLINCMAVGELLNSTHLIALKEFADANPAYGIEFLNHAEYLTEIENF